MELAFVYICLLAPQVTLSQLPINLAQNLRPTGRNWVYKAFCHLVYVLILVAHLNLDAIFPLRLGQIRREVDPRLVLVHRPLKAALQTHL